MFDKYIFDTYYEQIVKTVKGFIFNNKDNTDLSTYMVPEPNGFIEFDNFELYKINYEIINNCELNLEIIVIADVIVRQYIKGEMEVDTKTKFVSVYAEVELDAGIKNFRIYNTEFKSDQYKKSRNLKLSKDWVPYIRKKDFDDIAEKFLRKYYPQALTQPTPVPVETIVSEMGLSIHQEKLTIDNSVFGKMVFKDTDVEVIEDEKLVSKHFNKGSILVDKDVVFKRNVGSYNNTVIHECVHWELHKVFHEVKMVLDKDHSQVSSWTEENLADSSMWTSLDWMEWQANGIAPRILMPKVQTRIKIRELFQTLTLVNPDISRSELVQEVVDNLATFFEVSRQAAKIRMIDLGFKEANGVYNYLDDRYMHNFAFELEAFDKGSSYTITSNDLCFEYCFNESFRQIIDRNKFIYVDNHLCLKDKKFIYMTKDGPIMTDYAYEHMDECCLIFKVKSKNFTSISNETYYDYVLNRGVTKESEIKADFVDILQNPSLMDQLPPLDMMKLGKKISELLKELPFEFSGTLRSHRKRKNCTQPFLAKLVGITERTLRDYETLEDNLPRLELTLSFCFALKLRPELSDDMIKKAGHQLTISPPHQVYKMLLSTSYYKPLGEINSILQAAEMKTL
ncbi:TPA: ImmA/IrrE family metallo-endopeptidase [Streptococcus agalactiae]|uniref:ImmA/IrrE family metallo-endopeptidase n=1 Tax=Streptococcus agalactiae TaxID=1311 RepID=UPI0002BA9ACD|nr:ImmA/IrrE family metallo-endopeptidase [Streptococcus agalactiae]EPX07729.1 XRE family transcriptional regulator [Streptococcus agalactiae MRI Z1-049]AKU03163.1 XRE family transcriptional regulator [Streptococcus agalactiae]ASA89766.1 XRE family transcriptional regulator [Streptococcus agalactiae]EPV46758.1 XRE family transcriptional regulator [Streptococcus agalactiae GB00904]EPV58572.1 XRE family transcriptional regulator [Streptococcus agalactiae GB00923]